MSNLSFIKRAKKVECKNTDLTKKKNRPPVDLTVLDLTNSTIDLRYLIRLANDSVK